MKDVVKRDEKKSVSEDSQNEFSIENAKHTLSRNTSAHNPN